MGSGWFSSVFLLLLLFSEPWCRFRVHPPVSIEVGFRSSRPESLVSRWSSKPIPIRAPFLFFVITFLLLASLKDKKIKMAKGHHWATKLLEKGLLGARGCLRYGSLSESQRILDSPEGRVVWEARVMYRNLPEYIQQAYGSQGTHRCVRFCEGFLYDSFSCAV